MIRARAIVFTEPNRVELGEVDVPEPGSGQVLTRTLVTGVSTGTETRVLTGNERGATFPLIPGYENVGEIIAVGPGVDDLSSGMRIFLGGSQATAPYARTWGGQVEYALARNDEVVVVPDNVPPTAAIYIKTAAIALHGIKRAAVRSGETVVVVGQGLIGHLAAQAAKARGARVIVVDPVEARRSAALAAGVDITIDPNAEDSEARVKALTDGGADVAIDVTGVAATVDRTVRLLRVKPWSPPYPPSGRLVILGSYTEPVAFAYSPSLFDIEPDIFPSRDCTLDDMREVAALISLDLIRPSFIPALVLPFESAATGYQALLNRDAMRVLFDWSSP